jgi:hypothetical protein
MTMKIVLALTIVATMGETATAESLFFKSPGPGMHFTAGLPIQAYADVLPRDEAAGFPQVQCYWDGQLASSAANISTGYNYFPLAVAGNLVVPGVHELKLHATFRNGIVRDVALPVQVDPWPADKTQPCSAESGQQFCVVDLAADRTISNLNWTNVAVRGNGHKLTLGGNVTIKNSLITGLGSLTGIADPPTAVMVPGITGTLTGNVDIQNSVFEATGAVSLAINGNGDVAFRNNELRASNFVRFVPNDPDRSPVLELSGTNTRRKLFQGNRIASGRVVFSRMANWLIGSDVDELDADGNILMGPRCTINVIESSGVVVRGNYSFHNYRGEWSQGFNFVTSGSSADTLIEHNLIRSASWPVQDLAGEFRYNAVVGYGHQWIRTLHSGAKIHHNVFAPEGGGGLGSGVWAYLPWYIPSVTGVQIYNNTMDGGDLTGDFAGPFVEISDSLIQVTSLRNNLFTHARNTQNGSPGTPLVTATDGSFLYADYNAFYSPNSSQTENYDANIPGRIEGGPGYAGHDVSGTGATGVINGRLSNYPFAGRRNYPYDIDEGAVWNRRLKLSAVLSSFRNRYTPVLGSPVIDAGDVADNDSSGRRADIGAIDVSGHDQDRFGKYGHGPGFHHNDSASRAAKSQAVTVAPQLITPAEIQEIAQSGARWTALKNKCDTNLNKIIASGYSDAYAGWDWRAAAEDYATCYNVAKFLNLDANTISNYSKKAIAVMKVLARHHWYRNINGGTEAEGTVEYLALGNGATTVFALPRTPMPTPAVKVYLTPATELPIAYTSNRASVSSGFCPVLKISNTAGGPAAYTRETDYHMAWYNTLEWRGANHPALNSTYYVTLADKGLQTATGVSVSGSTITFATPPAANQVVAVQYLGPDFEQTGNFMGGVEGMKPDSLYMARTINVGLAYAYDLMRESPDLTAALRTELVNVLNAEVDFYEDYLVYDPTVPNDPYGGPEGVPLGNYSVRGHLTGAVYSAYATGSDNPRETQMKALARAVLMRTYDALDTYVPGGFGVEGSYNSGTDADLLHLFDIWKRVTGEDLAAQRRWTSNIVPAIIHGTKPDHTFYDGGDWHSLPALPHTSTLQAFAKYQPNHAMAPYARQLLADLGQPVPGAVADYKTFARSRLLEGTGALYARSAWSPDAVWLSLATGPIFLTGHQHYDRGHFTLHRGSDYLLINGGQFGGGARGTVPFSNSLGFDDRGAGNLIVYPNPPSQGAWETLAQNVAAKYMARRGFVYGQENLTPSYVNNDGVHNAVKRALRTLVLIRPDVVVLHDQAQTTNAGTKKFFNMNFGGTIARSGDVFSAVTGQSKVFMRSVIPANPTPTITPKGSQMESDPDNTTYPIQGDNYQVILPTGQTDDTFLHVFQATSAGQAQMVASTYLKSGDSRAQGVELNMGVQRWVVLNAVKDAQISGTLTYVVPTACPCTHVVGDLLPNRGYQITVADAVGTVIQTFGKRTTAAAVLFFPTPDAAAERITLTPLASRGN